MRIQNESVFACQWSSYLSIIENFDINIDHIKPCALAKNEQEMIELQHYTNLQWLLAEDNRNKGDKYEED